MKERITKMQATMNEIISRANTPQVIEMEDDSSDVTQQSCLSGGRGQQQYFENWCQTLQIPMLSARAAPVAVMPVCSVRLEPLALERPVTPVATREWARSLGSPLSTPVKVIASFYRKMTSSTDDAQETKAS